MNTRELWKSENREELQKAHIRNYILKDQQQKANPLGPWGPVPGAHCFAGVRVGSRSSGAVI